MATPSLKGRTALVTGASSGLGVDFANELAGLGCNLVLVARREDRLLQVQADLRQRHGVTVDIQTADLGDADARAALQASLFQANKSIDILVNNAGFGLFGEDLKLSWEKTNQMLQVDIVALTHLTRLFAPDMVQRGFGHVLQVASIGAYQPSPTYAAYSAAKAYVLSYGQALNYELKGTGVSCTVVSPGVTATEFLQVAGQKQTLYQRTLMMDSPTVARQGIAAMRKGRYSIITGWLNWAIAMMARVTPVFIITAATDRLMKF